MALTQNQRDEIIEQRLMGVPVAVVAKRTDHSHTTIVKVHKEWLAATARDRADELEALQASLVYRHEQAAFVARASGEQARQEGDKGSHIRYLKEERDSLREIARLTGAESAVKVDVSGQVDVTLVDERELLAEYVAGLCQSLN